jgi:hypothetical protein
VQLVVRFRRLLVAHELRPLRVPAQVALDMVARVREHLDLVVPLVALAPLVVLVLLGLSVHSDLVVLAAVLEVLVDLVVDPVVQALVVPAAEVVAVVAVVAVVVRTIYSRQ